MSIDASKHIEGEGTPFFKGKDIKKSSVSVDVKGVREANLPNTGNSLIIDFDFDRKERSLALNRTNIKRLIDSYTSNTDKWIGKEIKLKKVLVTNPKTKEEVEGIRIETSVQKELPVEKKKK